MKQKRKVILHTFIVWLFRLASQLEDKDWASRLLPLNLLLLLWAEKVALTFLL
jgi:hypothetical protein